MNQPCVVSYLASALATRIIIETIYKISERNHLFHPLPFLDSLIILCLCPEVKSCKKVICIYVRVFGSCKSLQIKTVIYLTVKMSVLSSHLLGQGFWDFRLLKLFVVCKCTGRYCRFLLFATASHCKLNKNTPH